MSKFLTGQDLINTVDSIIYDAEKTLLIVSPYIKLDEHFRKIFDEAKTKPKLHLILVFGKNEKKVDKSLKRQDFDYFKEFPNISIIYVPNLHGKYYGNEKKGVVTSINLYDFSFQNNIEFGVFSEQSFLNSLTSSADDEAFKTCLELSEENMVIFINRPVFKKKFLGKEFYKRKNLYDITEEFYEKGVTSKEQNCRMDQFPDEIEYDSEEFKRPERDLSKEDKIVLLEKQGAAENTVGYCIRTGVEIEFNPNKPLSAPAFKQWNRYKNIDFSEKYCHFSGEESQGETSVAKPILKKNWNEAKKFISPS